MTLIKINDTEIFYEGFGSGPPFLVMHGGLGVDHSYFRPALDPLGNFIKLIYYDHRGHGCSGRPPIETITFEQLADDADALREKLGIEKIGIIGHSAGGYVALNYAIRHPKTISHLILMDTGPASGNEEEIVANVQRKKPTPEMLEVFAGETASTAEGLREQLKILQPLYFHTYTAAMEKKAITCFENMVLIPEINQHQDSLLEKYDVSLNLKDIRVRTLILVGDDDFICPPSQARRMHDNIPNSELHIFEKCGHYPFWERPDEFYSAIRDWIHKAR
ncbi:MAG: alpha/beta fold hydrolase [Promethearchaeota archaeon]